MMKAVYVVGTLDTKREELAYVRDVVERLWRRRVGSGTPGQR